MSMYCDLEYINKRMAESPSEFVLECESEFAREINMTVEKVAESDSEIIMLAGPSSSGKTTTASLICQAAEKRGGKAYSVSLDDFYYDKGKGPKNEDGTFDFESVNALDIPCLCECLSNLVRNKSAELPVFDFRLGKRREEPRKIVLDSDDILVIEGLHALNPVIVGELPKSALTLVYISVSSRVTDGDNVILSKRELRFIRRMVRDSIFRASSPAATFEMWPRVLAGEDENLFPYENTAQIKINSFHPYEPCVFSQQAARLLDSVPSGSEYRERAVLLSEKLGKFILCDKNIVPPASLLREFIG